MRHKEKTPVKQFRFFVFLGPQKSFKQITYLYFFRLSDRLSLTVRYFPSYLIYRLGKFLEVATLNIKLWSLPLASPHNMFTTCSQHVHNMFTTCSFYVHDMFMKFSQNFLDMFKACSTKCSWHVHHMCTTCSPNVHRMFITCSSHAHCIVKCSRQINFYAHMDDDHPC